MPVNRDMPMSPTVKAKEPVIKQIFVGRGPDVFVTDALERKLYIIRRRAANAIKSLKLKHSQFYVPSFSARTINYKGLLLADQVGQYYLTCRTSGRFPRLPWCTSVSRPTPSRPGIWPTRSATSPTTVKSTPCAATWNWFKAREQAISRRSSATT